MYSKRVLLATTHAVLLCSALFFVMTVVTSASDNFDNSDAPRCGSGSARVAKPVISGRVVSSDGVELYGATVYLLPSLTRVPLGPTGEYSFANIPFGDISIAIIHPGFKLYSTTLTRGALKNLVMIPDVANEQAELYEKETELNKLLLACKPLTLLTRIKELTVKPVFTSASTSIDKPSVKLSEKPKVTITLADLPPPAPSQHIESMPIAEHHDAVIQTVANRTEGDLVLNLNVLPNPTSETASIQFRLSSEARVMLELFRLENGQRVVLEDFGARAAGDNTLNLNVASLAAGTYSVLVRASTCQYALTTFVKN